MKKALLISLFLLFPSLSFSQGYSTCQEAWVGDVHVETLPAAGLFYKAWDYVYDEPRVIKTTDTGVYIGKGCYIPDQMLTLPGSSWESRYVQSDMDTCTEPNKHYHIRRNGAAFTTYQTEASCPSIPDTDGDGVYDVFDECPGTPPDTDVDSVGCPSEPSTCSDGIVSGDELGIDCGGSCVAACIWRCPDDFGLIDSVCSYTGPFINCGDSLDCPVLQADATGSCPDNYQFDSGICFQVVGKILAAEDVAAPYVSPGDISFISSSLSSDTGINSTTVYNTVVDPGTGNITTTSTTINDNTYIDSSGTSVSSGESTVVRVLVESPTGDVLSDTSTSSSSFATPNIYSEPYDSSFASADFGTRFEVFTTNLENAPIYVPLKTIFSPDLSGGLSTYSLSMGSYGSVDFDFSDYADAWAVLRICLIFLAVFFSAKLIIANK